MDADLVIRNGKVYSVNLDGEESRGEAVAVSGGKIVAFGSDAEIERYIGENTEVIDARSNSILPGFSDAHLHATFTASAVYTCNLFGIFPNESNDKKELIRRYQDEMRAYIAERPDDEMYRGTGWKLGYFGFAQEDMPTKFDLDEVCSDKPVVLESFCQHHIWVNSKALEIAGIDKDTPDPRNGNLWKNDQGEPTGLLSEFSAMNIMKDNLPNYDLSVEKYKETLRQYQTEFANRYGVTLIFDALCTENGREAYREMAADGELTIRVAAHYYADPNDPETRIDEFIARKGADDIPDSYKVVCVKFFMEGSGLDFYLGEPYEAECLKAAGLPADYRGNPYWTAEELECWFTRLNEAGFQLHTHAMGDESVTHTIDAYEYAYNKTGKKPRNVIAHLMLVKDSDFARMGELGIVGCVQPTWMSNEPVMYEAYLSMLGAKRRDQLYPYKRLLDAGVVVASGTDFPVTPPPDQFVGLQTAMSRSLPECWDGYDDFKDMVMAPPDNPAQDIVDFKEAIKSLTISGAYQNFYEDVTGSIEVGKSADLVVLDRDLEDTIVHDIHKTTVRYTIFKGKTVYCSEDEL